MFSRRILLLFCLRFVLISLRAQVTTREVTDDHDYEAPLAFEALNSEGDDYAPSWDPHTGKLMFTSERSGWAMVYCCAVADNTDIRPAAGTFNEVGQHRAFVTFTRDGEAYGAVFMRRQRQSFPGIVSVLRDNGSLNAGRPVDGLAGEFFCSHPAVNSDGTRLVVSMERVGGEKGLDLWICERRNDRTWSEPQPLSDIVNSSGHEISPRFIGQDSLIYASNGYGGKGGYDLFLTVYRNGSWQEPEPLEWMNSEFDDSDAALLPDGSFVFASDRPGGKGGLDLYVSRRRKQR